MAAVVLSVTVLVTGNEPVEWVGAFAVWLATRRLSIADRTAEAERARVDAGSPPLTECYRWQVRYLFMGELAWTVYFVMLGAWSALVGVAWMLVYPIWRKVYRRYRPRSR